MHRRRKRVTLKRRLQCYGARFIVLAVFCVAGMFILSVANFIISFINPKENVPEITEKEFSVKSASTNKVQKMEKIETASISNALILVNKKNPLPESFDNELHLLKNGKNVSEMMYKDLRDMLFKGEEEVDGLSFLVASGYRTKAEQEALFLEEMEKNRLAGMDTEAACADAEKSVAPAGFSEHETGLCVDIVAESNQRMDETQEDTRKTGGCRSIVQNTGLSLDTLEVRKMSQVLCMSLGTFGMLEKKLPRKLPKPESLLKSI